MYPAANTRTLPTVYNITLHYVLPTVLLGRRQYTVGVGCTGSLDRTMILGAGIDTGNYSSTFMATWSAF